MRKLIFTCVIACVTSMVFGQYSEVGAFMGVSNYKGELKQNYLEPVEYHPAFGIFVRHHINRYFAVKGQFSKGKISGHDKNSPDPGERVRNLSFRSEIIEFSTTAEFYFSGIDILDGKVSAPYIFAGVGVFHFNPQTDYNGEWVDLRPLGTEGQRIGTNGDYHTYNLWQVNVPFGVGAKYCLGTKATIGIEFGMRKTFTDYLDDISGAYPDLDRLSEVDRMAADLSYRTPELYDGKPQSSPIIPGEMRGNPNDDDWYFFFGMNFSVLLADKRDLEYESKYRIWEQ